MDNEIEITIDGMTYLARPKEEVEAESQAKPKTGYERVPRGDHYYKLNGKSAIVLTECRDESDDESYINAIYYSDETIAKNNLRADKLMRQLRQWQALNDSPVKWDCRKKWIIGFNYFTNDLICYREASVRVAGAVYFTKKDKAEEAIEVFRDELMWYFTNYRGRMDMS